MNKSRLNAPNHRFLRALASFALLALASCDGAPRADEPPACEPACDAACGHADGCGGLCGCPSGQACDDEGACAPTECADCGANEHCVDGACVCRPACDDNACGDDGCGGICECPDGFGRDIEGNLKPIKACEDSCASAGWQCGVVCGERCGSCEGGAACTDGQCGCVPKCDGTSCSDGCGGSCDCAAGTVCNAADACVAPADCHDSCDSTDRSCGSVCGATCGRCAATESCVAYECSAALSCEDCALRMALIDHKVAAGALSEIRLAVSYQPVDGEPRARIADLRIVADKEVELLEVEQGPALLDVQKTLFADPGSGKLFQKREDGAFQLLAIGTLNAQPMATGEIAILTFKAMERGPVTFSLQRRTQTLAPAAADGALQSTNYDRVVVVTP